MGPDVSWRLTKSQLLWRLNSTTNGHFGNVFYLRNCYNVSRCSNLRNVRPYIIKLLTLCITYQLFVIYVCLLGLFLVNYTIIGLFFKNRMQNQKNIPFWPRVHYIYVSNIGPCTFFCKKKERKRNAMKSLRKVLFSFLISKCIDSFCHECRIPRWKKNPKEKLNGSLRVEKQKKKFYFLFF